MPVQYNGRLLEPDERVRVHPGDTLHIYNDELAFIASKDETRNIPRRSA